MSMSSADDFEWQDDFDRFKWGWNVDTREAVVWTVAGGADGGPAHREYLQERWGRPPSIERGDVLGLAYSVFVEGKDRPEEIAVEPYYASEVPAEVVAAFRETFPGVAISVLSN